jgi:hypothetical protein
MENWYQNTLELYWSLLSANHAELFAPLIDLYWRNLPAPDAALENRQRGWADFCITKGGQEDLTVRFVRVTKTAPPNPVPAK